MKYSQSGEIFTEITMKYAFHSVLTRDVPAKIPGVYPLDLSLHTAG